jgi:hypothetical protein
VAYNVTTADVEARWRPLSDAESDVATTLIGDAEALIDTYRSGLAAAVASGDVATRLVAMTICEAVIRVMANPDRLAQQSITADGGISMGWQFAEKVPAPRLRLTDLDLSAVDEAMAAAGYRTGRTASVKMSSTSWGVLNGSGSDDSEGSSIIPLPSRSDPMRMSDSVFITLS